MKKVEVSIASGNFPPKQTIMMNLIYVYGLDQGQDGDRKLIRMLWFGCTADWQEQDSLDWIHVKGTCQYGYKNKIHPTCRKQKQLLLRVTLLEALEL